jgi:ketosteroid isomerase-like protein
MTQLTEQDARQLFATTNSRNLDKALEQFSEDAVFQVPMMDSPIHGKKAIREFLTGAWTAFPDFSNEVTHVYVSGNETVIVNSIHGTHSGPLVGSDGKSIAATNKKFVQDEMTRVVVDEKGHVKSLRAYGNPSDLYRQLGLSK